MKRALDLSAATIGLIIVSPLLAVTILAIWLYDRKSPLYIASRVGRNSLPFKMYKLRSMVVDADKTGVTSTAASDRRITPVGKYVRRYKLDELVQLVNVIVGDMSLVGPRPNVPSGAASYTKEERGLLAVRPGITDIASIVFSDEAEILKSARDPDAAYDSLIRPWKSELGLIYIARRSLFLDLQLVFLTVAGIFSRRTALAGIHSILTDIGARPELIQVCERKLELRASLPPGARAPHAVHVDSLGT